MEFSKSLDQPFLTDSHRRPLHFGACQSCFWMSSLTTFFFLINLIKVDNYIIT